MSEKRPIGRPSKYKKEYCEMLISHMSTGLSFESFAAVVETCDDTLREWCKVHPEFSAARKLAYAKCRVFWEKAGLSGMFMGGKDNPFNSAVWIFNMKNRFLWRDSKEVEVTQSSEIRLVVEKDDTEL